MTIFWRILYSITANHIFIAILVQLIKLVELLFSEDYAARFLRFLSYVFTVAIPRPPAGYVDLYTSRLSRYLVQHRRLPVRVQAQPRVSRDIQRPSRVGAFGYWVGTGPRALFEAFPDDVEAFIFDVQITVGYRAEWLRSMFSHYVPLVLRRGKIETPLQSGWADTDYQPLIYGPEVSDAELVQRAAKAINDANLDLLMIYGHEREDYLYTLLDLIDTPCIVHLCNSPDIIHHDKVSYYIYTHPEGRYYLQGNQLFCAATQAAFSEQRMYPGSLYYDPRGCDLNAPVPQWNERDPLIVFHGALYKLAGSEVLDIILKLLYEDSALEFVFMGRTDKQNWQLPHIQSMAERYSVASRVHYAGNFLVRWDVTCSEVVPDWDKIVAYLKRARLYANPFPYGGGQARFQNYAWGVPSVHMGVEFGISHGWRQYLVEVPALLVPQGTAYSKEAYLMLCDQCLHNETFANQLIAEQRTVARKASDPSIYWKQLFDSYHDWLNHSNI